MISFGSGEPTGLLPLGLAFLAGLLGSGHCLGMCGSLVSGLFLKLGAGSILPHLAYHGARVGVYALVGLVAASFGTVLTQSGGFGQMQGLLQIVAGAIVILLGLDMVGLSPWRATLGFAPIAWVRGQFVAATRRGPLLGAVAGGLVNGLMPCPMTMAMAVKSATAPTPWQGGLLMLAFGLGTLPSMLFAGLLFGRLGGRARNWLLRAAAVLVIGLGLATLWQGLSFYLIMRRLLG